MCFKSVINFNNIHIQLILNKISFEITRSINKTMENDFFEVLLIVRAETERLDKMKWLVRNVWRGSLEVLEQLQVSRSSFMELVIAYFFILIIKIK